MPSPYGMEFVERCIECKLRERNIFCNLPPRVVQAIDGIKYTTSYPPAAILFVEGQPPRGAFILCKGRVKLYISSSDGKTLILRVAEAGEVLGLSAAVSGETYALTAETLGPAQVTFLRRDDLSRLMHEHPEVALRVALHLADRYSNTCHEMRSLMLTHSAAGKLATDPGVDCQSCHVTPAGISEDHPDSRGNCADHWHLAGNRYPRIYRVPEEAVDQYTWFYAGGPQQSSP